MALQTEEELRVDVQHHVRGGYGKYIGLFTKEQCLPADLKDFPGCPGPHMFTNRAYQNCLTKTTFDDVFPHMWKNWPLFLSADAKMWGSQIAKANLQYPLVIAHDWTSLFRARQDDIPANLRSCVISDRASLDAFVQGKADPACTLRSGQPAYACSQQGFAEQLWAGTMVDLFPDCVRTWDAATGRGLLTVQTKSWPFERRQFDVTDAHVHQSNKGHGLVCEEVVFQLRLGKDGSMEPHNIRPVNVFYKGKVTEVDGAGGGKITTTEKDPCYGETLCFSSAQWCCSAAVKADFTDASFPAKPEVGMEVVYTPVSSFTDDAQPPSAKVLFQDKKRVVPKHANIYKWISRRQKLFQARKMHMTLNTILNTPAFAGRCWNVWSNLVWCLPKDPLPSVSPAQRQYVSPLLVDALHELVGRGVYLSEAKVKALATDILSSHDASEVAGMSEDQNELHARVRELLDVSSDAAPLKLLELHKGRKSQRALEDKVGAIRSDVAGAVAAALRLPNDHACVQSFGTALMSRVHIDDLPQVIQSTDKLDRLLGICASLPLGK